MTRPEMESMTDTPVEEEQAKQEILALFQALSPDHLKRTVCRIELHQRDDGATLPKGAVLTLIRPLLIANKTPRCLTPQRVLATPIEDLLSDDPFDKASVSGGISRDGFRSAWDLIGDAGLKPALDRFAKHLHAAQETDPYDMPWDPASDYWAEAASALQDAVEADDTENVEELRAIADAMNHADALINLRHFLEGADPGEMVPSLAEGLADAYKEANSWGHGGATVLLLSATSRLHEPVGILKVLRILVRDGEILAPSDVSAIGSRVLYHMEADMDRIILSGVDADAGDALAGLLTRFSKSYREFRADMEVKPESAFDTRLQVCRDQLLEILDIAEIEDNLRESLRKQFAPSSDH